MTLTHDQLCHIVGVTFNGYTGASVLSLLRGPLGLALAAEDVAARHFANGANPGGVLSVEGQLSADAKDRLERNWAGNHQGTANAGRVAVLEEKTSFTPIAISLADSQMIETRRFSVAEICRVFGPPPHMVADTEKSTSWGTGISEQNVGFVTYVLRPWLVRLEQAMSASLLLPHERGEYAIKFNVRGLLRGSIESQMTMLNTGINNGIYSVNEGRAYLDMNPIPGGDDHLRPLNMAVLGQTQVKEETEPTHGD